MSTSKKVAEALRLIELRKGETMSKEELRRQAIDITVAECHHSGDTTATAASIEHILQIKEDARTNSERAKGSAHG